MKIKVYHAKEPNFGMGDHPEFNNDNYDLVAEVEVAGNAYGEAFRLTNHIDKDWWANPEVTCIKRSRSTSVGDVIVDDDGVRRRCEMIGWTEF